MAVSKRLRFEILRRDGHCCRYCGEHASPTVKLTVDHVTPVALGGTDSAENLVAACQPCNAGKAATNPDRPLVADVSDAALMWAEAVDVAYHAAVVELMDLADYAAVVDERWTSHAPFNRTAPRPDGWQQSIDTFRRKGVPVELILAAVDKAMVGPAGLSGKWKYCMGTVWRMVEEIEADAKNYYDRQQAKRARANA